MSRTRFVPCTLVLVFAIAVWTFFCLGLGLGLGHRYEGVAYCDINEDVRKLIHARMDDGLIPKAPVFDDIKKLDKEMAVTGVSPMVAVPVGCS